jgi:hypothetical protein
MTVLEEGEWGAGRDLATPACCTSSPVTATNQNAKLRRSLVKTLQDIYPSFLPSPPPAACYYHTSHLLLKNKGPSLPEMGQIKIAFGGNVHTYFQKEKGL